MSAVFASLIPTFLIIATGWLCRTTDFVSEQQWAGLERATYVIFFPALIIDTLSRADLSARAGARRRRGADRAILIMAVIMLALRPVLARQCGIDGPSFTSIFQGATRWNTFVGPCGRGQPVRPARRRADRGGDRRHGAAAQPAGLLRVHPLRGPAAAEPLRDPALVRRQSVHLVLRDRAGANLLAPPLPKPVAVYIEFMGRAALAPGLLVVGAGLDIRRLARPGPAARFSRRPEAVPAAGDGVVTRRCGGRDRGRSRRDHHRSLGALRSAAYVLARQMGGNAP